MDMDQKDQHRIKWVEEFESKVNQIVKLLKIAKNW